MVSLLGMPLVAVAVELQVGEGSDEHPWTVIPEKGDQIAIRLKVVGPPPPPPEETGIDTCRDSSWFFGSGFALLVLRGEGRSSSDRLLVPLDSPGEVTAVRAYRDDERLVVTVSLHYKCNHWRGESWEDRWVAIGLDDRLTLLHNSSFGLGGRICFGGDWFEPIVRPEPSWVELDGHLRLRVGVHHVVCYFGDDEQRGFVEWRPGYQPEPAPLDLPVDLVEVGQRARALGFQPYAVVDGARGLRAVVGERPLVKLGERLVSFKDRRGATGAVLLPQIGRGGAWRAVAAPSNAAADRSDYVLNEFPELAHSDAFHWSEPFLSARRGAEIHELVHRRGTAVVELVLPCVAASVLAPTDSTSERWLLRLDRRDRTLDIEGYLVEACSAVGVGFDEEHLFPAARVEASEQGVTIRYGGPGVCLDSIEQADHALDVASDLERTYRTAAVQVRLDAPTQLIARVGRALPSEGPRWALVQYPMCEVQIMFFTEAAALPGLQPGDTTFPAEWTKLESSRPPDPCPLDRIGVVGPAAVRLSGKIEVDGALSRVDVTSSPASATVDSVVRAVIAGWRFLPALDTDGHPLPTTMQATVLFGQHVAP